MRRSWFKDDDGTYYRNIPLIDGDMARPVNWVLPWRRRALEAEWSRAWTVGVIRAEQINASDRVATPRPFREAYPHMPGLWVLDDRQDAS